jgi:hypothetical protein
MLHESPLMVDANVDHWRNLQSLILESAKGKRRIIVIHEDGAILKFVHSMKAEIVKPIDRIDDPQVAAKAIYEANPGACDFVAVFERRGFDRYFGAFQDAWRADEDLDVYVQRTYAMMISRRHRHSSGSAGTPGLLAPRRDIRGGHDRHLAPGGAGQALSLAFRRRRSGQPRPRFTPTVRTSDDSRPGEAHGGRPGHMAIRGRLVVESKYGASTASPTSPRPSPSALTRPRPPIAPRCVIADPLLPAAAAMAGA